MPITQSARRLMGSQASVTVVGADADLAKRLLDYGGELEAMWSRFLPESELSVLETGAAVCVSAPTRELIARMRDGMALTEGAFDPTLIREVIRIGYDTSVDGTTPAVQPRESTPVHSLDRIDLNSTPLRFPNGLALDAGGIGKGFAADLLVERAREHGARGVLVSLGGDISVWGDSAEAGGWRIGIEDPFTRGRNVSIVRLDAGSVATSSQRVRRFNSLAGNHSHLINPHTRASVETPVQTVSVIAGAGWFAEACTKPGFIWPADKFLNWVPTVNAAALLVFADGSYRTSENWEAYL